MKRSTDRILTTHVGSLIRPPALRAFLSAKEAREPFDLAAYAKCLNDSVAEVVRKQADIGIDVISDGEFGKAISWAQYALFRLGGFERRQFAGGNPFTRGVDRTRFAEFYAELDSRDKVETVMDSVVVAPITYSGQAELQQDIDNFKAALRGVHVVEAFLPVAAPSSLTEYRAWLARQVETTNHAIKGLPREKIRYHVCWGSWPGPHSSDVPFKDIADLVLQVRAGGYSIELANPRHEHEWRLWEHLKLPNDTVLIPGVISHATNIVEHPELVAERVVRLARLVGRENVIAS